MKEGIMERDEAKNGAWEDVTEGCALTWGYKGHEIKVVHDGIIVAIVGQRVNHINSGGLGKAGDKAYRVTVTPDSDPLWSGRIKIEHFVPDPEPVIAYKAVRVENGKYLSVLVGDRAANTLATGAETSRELQYTINEVTHSPSDAGIFCFETLDGAKAAYAGLHHAWVRSLRPLTILEVEAYGEGVPYGANRRPPGSINYSSVKVLSVAWEEEKKEEWVDVTSECKPDSAFGAGQVKLRHNGVMILSMGANVYVESCSLPNYRVTFINASGGFQGSFKVEKRND